MSLISMCVDRLGFARKVMVIMATFLLVCASVVRAENVAPAEKSASAENVVDAEADKSIRGSLPAGAVSVIAPTPIDGLYQVELVTGELLLITKDGQYLINGDILKIMKSGSGDQLAVSNITEEYRGKKRIRLLDNIESKDLITYAAKGEKRGEVYVFTDTDCIYCRKFHAEIPKLNSMGIEVSYLAWPRAGLESGTGKTMTNIWCSKDKLSAMDRGKSGSRVSASGEGIEVCKEIVSKHRMIGEQIGVRGTPAVYLRDGRQVGGYVTASELARQMGLNSGS